MAHHPKLPFRVSPGAVAHIQRWSHPRRSLRATMMTAYANTEYGESGEVEARFDREHLIVGYHRSSQVTNWAKFEIGGNRIAICPDTLARLGGKTITLKKTAGHSSICPYVLVAA
jgi:hypothetical protein